MLKRISQVIMILSYCLILVSCVATLPNGEKSSSKELNEDGRTLLMDAVEAGSEGDVKRLVKQGANFASYDPNGHAVIHLCILGNQLDMIKLLLDHGR